MPNTPTTSFIPKQGPTRRTKQTASRQIHLLMIVSYLALVSSLLASVGVFFYKNYVSNQLTKEVENLSSAIAGFSDEDMERAREFNVRLWQTKFRLDRGVSVVSVFDALEAATVKAVTIDELQIKNDSDETVTLSAKLATDSFDSALFQRGLYERSDIVDAISVKDVSIVELGDAESVSSGVSLTATLHVPAASIPLPQPEITLPDEEPLFEPVASSTVMDIATTTASTTVTEESNPETL